MFLTTRELGEMGVCHLCLEEKLHEALLTNRECGVIDETLIYLQQFKPDETLRVYRHVYSSVLTAIGLNREYVERYQQ